MTDVFLAKPVAAARPEPTRRAIDQANLDTSMDTSASSAPAAGAASKPGQDDVGFAADRAVIEMIELLFFAYRDFVGDPDTILNEFAFGRAHHRVLYFVNRNAGMTVADLLDILKITKQSLGRVLRDLIDAKFVVQRPGEFDRRQRLLFPTAAGRALAHRLTEPQMRRISQAFDVLGPESAAATSRFLRLMINERDRAEPGRSDGAS